MDGHVFFHHEGVKKRRKKRIGEEMKLGEHFEYKIVNDKLDETVEKILKIIEEVRGNGSGYN